MATITISNTGGNWNATGTWVGGVVPTSADDVVATATSGPLTVTANAAANTVNFTSYANTFSVNSGVSLTITVGFTMVASMSVSPSSTGTLVFVSSQTITSGGIVWPGNIQCSLTGSRTYTLGDNWSIEGSLDIRFGGAVQCTLTANQLQVKGDVIVGSIAAAYNATLTGTTTLVLATGTSQTITSLITITAVRMLCPLVINASGTVIFSTPAAALRVGNVTYTAGNVVSVGATLWAFGSQTLTTSLMTWDCNWYFQSSASTFTFGSDFNISNLGGIQLDNLTGGFVLNGNNINLSGYLTMTWIGFGGNITGTTTINLLGNCTVSQNSGMQLRLPVVINSSGTVTFATSFSHGAALTFNGGNVSMDISLIWNVVPIGGGQTYTFNSSGFTFPAFSVSTSHTFAGSEGCNFYSYSISTTAAGVNQTFQSTNTYNIINRLSLLGTVATLLTVRSSSGGSQAKLNLYYGASMDVGHVASQDIDSSGGQTIWNYKGTLSNTLNWQELPTVPKTIGVPWVR